MIIKSIFILFLLCCGITTAKAEEGGFLAVGVPRNYCTEKDCAKCKDGLGHYISQQSFFDLKIIIEKNGIVKTLHPPFSRRKIGKAEFFCIRTDDLKNKCDSILSVAIDYIK